jgi:hypothetical protein
MVAVCGERLCLFYGRENFRDDMEAAVGCVGVRGGGCAALMWSCLRELWITIEGEGAIA